MTELPAHNGMQGRAIDINSRYLYHTLVPRMVLIEVAGCSGREQVHLRHSVRAKAKRDGRENIQRTRCGTADPDAVEPGMA